MLPCSLSFLRHFYMVAVVALVDGDCPRYRHHVAASLRAAWG